MKKPARHDPTEARRYWVSRACGDVHAGGFPRSARDFDRADSFRYSIEPVDAFATFQEHKGMAVLEVGTGMGGDLARFLDAGALAIGIDLSPAAIRATATRLRLKSLPMRLVGADALRLPFRDRTFDFVWSWGVLHHTNDIQSAVHEIFRVLRSGGETRLMLYHRPSWVALAAWGRWGLLRGRPFCGLKRVVAENIESPGTLALSRREIASLLRDFQHVGIEIVGSYWDRKFVPALGRLAPSRLGWFALVRARKP